MALGALVSVSGLVWALLRSTGRVCWAGQDGAESVVPMLAASGPPRVAAAGGPSRWCWAPGAWRCSGLLLALPVCLRAAARLCGLWPAVRVGAVLVAVGLARAACGAQLASGGALGRLASGAANCHWLPLGWPVAARGSRVADRGGSLLTLDGSPA